MLICQCAVKGRAARAWRPVCYLVLPHTEGSAGAELLGCPGAALEVPGAAAARHRVQAANFDGVCCFQQGRVHRPREHGCLPPPRFQRVEPGSREPWRQSLVKLQRQKPCPSVSCRQENRLSCQRGLFLSLRSNGICPVGFKTCLGPVTPFFLLPFGDLIPVLSYFGSI